MDREPIETRNRDFDMVVELNRPACDCVGMHETVEAGLGRDLSPDARCAEGLDAPLFPVSRTGWRDQAHIAVLVARNGISLVRHAALHLGHSIPPSRDRGIRLIFCEAHLMQTDQESQHDTPRPLESILAFLFTHGNHRVHELVGWPLAVERNRLNGG